MRECACCPSVAKMTAEHITSEWMGRLFPSEKEFRSIDRFGNVSEWTDVGLDIKAKVLCESCNNYFGASIEDKHALPTMTPLMIGDINAPFGKKEAQSLAIFAFKSAVIVDYAQRHREPFFSRRIRHAFRKHFVIPTTVAMWMCPYVPHIRKRRFDYRVSLHSGELLLGHQLHTAVYTFGLAALAFQVVAAKQLYFANFAPLPGFDKLAIRFWPELEPGYIWPGTLALRSYEQFREFHARWDSVAPV